MATRVKRYEAPLEQFDALLARIESEMGPDARLETREFRRGGVMGVGGMRMVEIVASVNVDVLQGSAPRSASGPVPLSSTAAPGSPRSAEPRWARPGISIQADADASPQRSQPPVERRTSAAAAPEGLVPPRQVAPLLSDYRTVERRKAEPVSPPAGSDSRIEQHLETLKSELARLQRSSIQTPDVHAPLSARPAAPASKEVDDLKATVAELTASVQQMLAERRSQQTVQPVIQSLAHIEAQSTAQASAQDTEKSVAESAVRSSLSRLASQGGGSASLPRGLSSSAPVERTVVERPAAERSQVAAERSQVASERSQVEDEWAVERLVSEPGGDLLRAGSDEDDSSLWELVEPVRAQPELPAPVQAEQETELRLPQLPSITSPTDSGAAEEQLSQIKNRAYLRLLNSNIDSINAMQLVERAAAELGNHMRFGDARPELVEEALLTEIQGEICRDILVGGGIELRGGLPGRVVALVGPTGVGKTTCIAKLAAHFAFQRGRSVGLVSLDTYRIAAAEQLKTYAEIMGLPIQVVYSADELDEALVIARARHELTLVDTAGASPLGGKQLLELGKAFTRHTPDEVHLVLSATTKADDLRLVLENFKMLAYSRLILSKLDETRGLGALYNVNRYASAPISYFAVGQSVPEDLRVAELEFIQHWVTTGAVK